MVLRLTSKKAVAPVMTTLFQLEMSNGYGRVISDSDFVPFDCAILRTSCPAPTVQLAFVAHECVRTIYQGLSS